MAKIIVVEESEERAYKLQHDLISYFKNHEIEVIQNLQNIDLLQYIDNLFASYDLMVVNELQKFFGSDKVKTRILDGLSSPYGNIFCTGLENAFTQEARNIDYPIDCLIDEVFMVLGLRRHLTGTLFLKSAIKMAVETPCILMRSITTQLYPHIAEQHNTTSTKVERAIRHCLDTCFNNNRFIALNTLFKAKVFSEQDKPSNGEFIALIADKILLKLDDHNSNIKYNFS